MEYQLLSKAEMYQQPSAPGKVDRGPIPPQQAPVVPPTDDVTYNGLDLVIEVRAGNSVEKTKENGEKWYFYTPYHYGYILGTGSMEEGEELDVFLNPQSEEGRGEPVYIVQLIMPDGEFEEEKVFLGWTSSIDVKAAFYQVYPNFHCIVFAMTLDDFGKYLNSREGEWKGEEDDPEMLSMIDPLIEGEVPVEVVDLGANEGVAELTDLDALIQDEAAQDNSLVDAARARGDTLALSLANVSDREELLRKCRELRFLGASILKESRVGSLVKATFTNEFGTGMIKSRTEKKGFIVEQTGRTNSVGSIVGFADTAKEAYEKVAKEAALLKAAGLWNTEEYLLKVRSDNLERVSKGEAWLKKAQGVVVETLARAKGQTAFDELVGKLQDKGNVSDPAAVAAYLGRKKYGASEFARMGAAGRARAGRRKKSRRKGD